MNVTPEIDGSLLANHLDPDTVYDMGNARLYAQCDAQGRITRAFVPEGFPLLTMRSMRYLVLDDNISVDTTSAETVARSLADQFKGTDSEGTGSKRKQMWQAANAQVLTFDTAHALGRMWTLTQSSGDVSVTVTTFLDEASPAVFQRVQITNQGTTTRVFALDVAISLQFSTGYIGASSAASGRVRAPLQFEANFGATLTPWQVVMDKTHHVLSYALPVVPGQMQEFCLVTAAGNETTVDEWLRNWRQALASAYAYNERLKQFASYEDDALLQSLIVAGLNAGLSAYKQLDSGVAGFCAGVNYAYPPRVYFRDSYWTAQAALIVQPPMVRDNLLWLARGISADGSCPSATWNPGLFTAAEAESPSTLKWLNDHYDSPSFFVMLLHDYVVATHDLDLLGVTVNGVTLWQHAAACMDYLTARDEDGDGLFEKPHTANDWADNVRRSGLVTYDLALFYRGLRCAAWLGKQIGDSTVRFETQEARVKAAINQQLWDETLGYYHNYHREGFSETNLSIDTLLTVLYGVADEQQSERVLDAAKRLLQTRNNHEQTHGDWGIMCCYPFYHQPADLFSISADTYRYHNGSDWPYWDGVYGLILMQRNDPDWRYVLSRWWEMSLERGFLTPFEYWSPPYPVGGLLQGWSALPAVALLSQRVTWQNREPGG